MPGASELVAMLMIRFPFDISASLCDLVDEFASHHVPRHQSHLRILKQKIESSHKRFQVFNGECLDFFLFHCHLPSPHPGVCSHISRNFPHFSQTTTTITFF